MEKQNPHIGVSLLVRIGLIFLATLVGLLLTWAVGEVGSRANFDASYTAAPRAPRLISAKTTLSSTPNSSQVVITETCTPVSITHLYSGSPAQAGETVHFTATVTGTLPITYHWGFGDNSPPNVGVGLNTTSHTYTATGVFTVTLIVTNTCGASSDSLPVDVSPLYIYLPVVMRNYVPLRADFTAAPTRGLAPLTVVFTNTSAGPYTISLWSFGDDVTSTHTSPTHTYTTVGTYTVALTVSGPSGTSVLPGGTSTMPDETSTLVRPDYITVITTTPPHTPSNPTPADGATDQGVDVDLSWTGGDPDGDAVTYDVYLEVGDDTPDVQVSDNLTGTTYDPGPLTPGAHYYWQIVVADANGAVTTGLVWDFTTSNIPAAPSNLQTTPVSSNQIRLNWQDNSSNETGFSIYDGSIWVANVGANAVSYTAGGLQPNSYHCFRVHAFNTYGASLRSNWGCATTSPCGEGIVNGSFETGSGWVIPVTEYPAAYTAAITHTGSRSMRTGIVTPVDNRYSHSVAQQTVTIPAGVVSATLRFWLYPLSGEPPAQVSIPAHPLATTIQKAALADDRQYVLVLNDHDQWINTLVWQRKNDQKWTFYQFNLGNYAGQTIKLQFGTYNDGWDGITALYVDDVALEICVRSARTQSGQNDLTQAFRTPVRLDRTSDSRRK